MTIVAKTKADSYQPQIVQAALQEALHLLGGLDKFIQAGETVLIKPNMVEAMKPDTAVTTHPEVLRAVIKAVQALGATPIVGDSPGYESTHKVAEVSGMLQVCREENAELVAFAHSVKVQNPNSIMVKSWKLADVYSRADKIISLAKMKTHSLTGITGAVKNLFGFILGTSKAQFHLRMHKRDDFATMLIDLHDTIKPTLAIIDGIVGMEGAGPRNGTPIHCGILIASSCAYAADMVMEQSMGLPAAHTPVIRLALEHGRLAAIESVQVQGSAADINKQFAQPKNYEQLQDRVPAWLVSFSQKQFTACPRIDDSCIRCGRCMHHCPPKAMTMGESKVQIDYTKCIRCYCCQEFCPANAISLRDGLLLSIWKKIKFK